MHSCPQSGALRQQAHPGGTAPGLARFPRRTKDHRLRVDNAAIATDARLDGRWPIRTSDDILTPSDLAILTPSDLAEAHKRLQQADQAEQVEHGWSDTKGALRLRPACHFEFEREREREAWPRAKRRTGNRRLISE